MARFLCKFTTDDTGAVTVEWVVVTALVIAMLLAVMVSVDTGVGAALDGIARRMSGSN